MDEVGPGAGREPGRWQGRYAHQSTIDLVGGNGTILYEGGSDWGGQEKRLPTLVRRCAEMPAGTEESGQSRGRPPVMGAATLIRLSIGEPVTRASAASLTRFSVSALTTTLVPAAKADFAALTASFTAGVSRPAGSAGPMLSTRTAASKVDG